MNGFFHKQSTSCNAVLPFVEENSPHALHQKKKENYMTWLFYFFCLEVFAMLDAKMTTGAYCILQMI